MAALEAASIKLNARLPLLADMTIDNSRYLLAKKSRLGHLL